MPTPPSRWLNGIHVRGSWNEFVRDYLSHHPLAPELDKAKVAQKAKEAINSRTVMYLVYHPDKTAWTPEDHPVPFIVTVLADNLLHNGQWSETDWKRKNIEITKSMFEVLAFLRATAFSPDAEPPQYEA
jgi:hypothetical protein